MEQAPIDNDSHEKAQHVQAKAVPYRESNMKHILINGVNDAEVETIDIKPWHNPPL